MEYTDISIEAKLKEAAEKTEAALEQYFRDGWGGDTVLAEALVDSLENAFKILEIHNEGILENLFTGDLGISALYTLTGHHRCLGNQLGCLLNGFHDAIVQR